MGSCFLFGYTFENIFDSSSSSLVPEMGSWAIRVAADGSGHQQLNRPSLLTRGGRMHKNPLCAAPCPAQHFPGRGERERVQP